jgi:P4 family phage/plasmid primase-like protien
MDYSKHPQHDATPPREPTPGYRWNRGRDVRTSPHDEAERRALEAQGYRPNPDLPGTLGGPYQWEEVLDVEAAQRYREARDLSDEESARQVHPNGYHADAILSNGSDPETATVAVDPRSFFSEKGTLLIGKLAAAIQERTGRMRSDASGMLYHYEDGVYLPDGETHVRRWARLLLGPSERRHYIGEVVSHIIDLERADPLSLDPDEQLVIRARNGIVDPVEAWRAAKDGRPYEPEPYTPENATTIRLPWDYRPGADCPKIRTFLGEVFAGEYMAALANFSWEIAGYTLLSRNPLRKAFLLSGPTGSGKSVWLTHLTGLIGKRQVSSESLSQLGSVRFSSAQLVGKLANICADIGTQAAEDSSIFKRITGGDYVSAERKMRDGFDFLPSTTLLFSANESPGSKDVSDAYFRRWVVIEFPNQFEEDAAKETELRALASDQAEMEGYLRYAVEAAGRLLERGDFEIPQAAAEAHERYRHDVDSVAGWLASDEVTVGGGGQSERKLAYEAYARWCKAEGNRHALGRSKFYGRVRQDRRIEEKTVTGVDYFANLRVPAEWTP